MPELDRGDGLHPMVVGLEFPEFRPAHSCRALLATGDAFAALASELWRLIGELWHEFFGELLFAVSATAPGSEPFGVAVFPSKRPH